MDDHLFSKKKIAHLLESINTIENNISTRIGAVISTDYSKQD